MSETNEKPTDFTATVPPPSNVDWWLNKDKKAPMSQEEKTQVKQDTLDNATLTAQQRIVQSLSSVMTEYQVDNMKNLAPQDKFVIGGETYTRQKITPKKLKELREAEKKYREDVEKMEDAELKQDREWQLLAYKASLYLNMTNEQFEDTDIEFLQTVIQATELRTQGFRHYK